MDKATVLEVLNRKWTKADMKKENWTKLNDIKIAKMFSFFNYTQPLVVSYAIKELGKAQSVKTIISNFVKRCDSVGIALAEFSREKMESNPINKKNSKTPTDKAIQKMKPILDLFNLNSKSYLEAIKKVNEQSGLSTEDIIFQYKAIQIALLARARGEIVTRQTNIKYVIEEDEYGNQTKEIAKNKEGKQHIYETTQSHLPDPNAIVASVLVGEIIERLEGGNSLYATDAELEEQYQEHLKQISMQEANYSQKEYTDAELEAIDVEIDEDD